MTKPKTHAAHSGTCPSDCSATRERALLLHEAICRCSTCKGTTDKTRLCRVCAEHDAEIDKLQNAEHHARCQAAHETLAKGETR